MPDFTITLTSDEADTLTYQVGRAQDPQLTTTGLLTRIARQALIPLLAEFLKAQGTVFQEKLGALDSQARRDFVLAFQNADPFDQIAALKAALDAYAERLSQA